MKKPRLSYLKRVLTAYVVHYKTSNLSFWHTPLKLNTIKDHSVLDRYYMNFTEKTRFAGPFDAAGVPVLDYGGSLGLQYNPNAVAQYALGYYDLYRDTADPECRRIFLVQADWFVRTIRLVPGGIGLWEYKFDFEYHRGLKAPWRSALAQGQGISVLARAYALTGEQDYLTACRQAFQSFLCGIDQPGGVSYEDKDGSIWLEELIFDPPTHVLNGFIWALWGVYDYYLLTREESALRLYERAVKTLVENIHRYDLGCWTRYHLVHTGITMVVSSYYQRLHICQAEAMYRLTGEEVFRTYALRWQRFYANPVFRAVAFIWKALFKLCYY